MFIYRRNGMPEKQADNIEHGPRLDTVQAAEVRQHADAMKAEGRSLDALQCWHDAMLADPGHLEYAWEYGSSLIQTGRVDEGVQILRQVAEQVPDNPKLHSCCLRMLHYANLDEQVIFEAYEAWGRRFADAVPVSTSHANSPAPDRVLRIGYVSPDYYRHSVAYFFESLLDGHDRDAFEIVGYGQVVEPDDVTERLIAKFDLYRDIQGMDDAAVAQLIEQDGIDILVDLAGHTEGNRLLVLARRPAPIQMTYLGHPSTTGMCQVDYRLTDAQADAAHAQSRHTEQLVMLPDGFLCYRPPEYAPPVAPLPALTTGRVTFGSFNNNCKLTPVHMALWAQVLNAVPQSRLILKFRWGGDTQIQGVIRETFASHGIAPERIEVYGRCHALEHLAWYHHVDIGLDTFPYHGTTTTCEAFWMGVPAVTLVGRAHASRVGLSLLTRVGLEYFAADTQQAYVAKACALASQPQALSQIRQSMRARMTASSLCQPKTFTRQVESAFRTAWRTWCDTQKVEDFATAQARASDH